MDRTSSRQDTDDICYTSSEGRVGELPMVMCPRVKQKAGGNPG